MENQVGIRRVLKPQLLGLAANDVVDCLIVGSHEEHDNGFLYLPVDLVLSGEILLNKSRKREFIEVLGHSSDAWIGSHFRAVVVWVVNPQTKESVLSWQVVPDSIKAGV